MDIVFVLLPLSLVMASLFLVLFVRAARSGQFDDVDDAAYRVVVEDD